MEIEQMEHIGFLERMIKMMDKYGLWKIFQATLVLAGFLYIMYNVQNLPEIVSGAFTRETELRQVEHDAAVEVRRSIKPNIDFLLKDALTALNADRAFILEMHNGTNNVAGLPFIYGEMTYEEVRNNITHVDEDYTSINLSRFTFPMYLEKNHMWHGNIDELGRVDQKLAARLASNDVTYFAIIGLNGVTNELGYFGFSFCNGKTAPTDKEIENCLTSTAQRLSILLDSKREY
jgi:hypothetical protein